MSQFQFLKPEFADIYNSAAQAEAQAHSDPRATALYARIALEAMVDWLYRREKSLKTPYETNLAAYRAEPTFQALVGQTLSIKARFVKDVGNSAAHGKPVSFMQAASALREFFHLAYWLARTYAKGAKPPPEGAFKIDDLPRLTAVPTKTLAQLQEIARRFEDTIRARDEAENARRVSEDGRLALEAELASARAEIAAIRAANQTIPDRHDYNEAATRDLYIDMLLREAGFDPQAPETVEVEVSGMPTGSGQGFVDYVLRGADGKPLGLIEAKRTRHDPRVGQQQAKLYADCLERQYGQRPIIFYTNGYEHWIWDDAASPPRPIQGCLKRDELALIMQRRTIRNDLASQPIDNAIVERPYQHRAIRRVCEAFERDRQRKALLVMATGAGKTRTVIALCELLMRANWVRTSFSSPIALRLSPRPKRLSRSSCPARRPSTSAAIRRRRAASTSRPIRR
jgi:type I restriction enzyme, R subunit